MEMPSLAGGLHIPEYPGDYFHYVFVKILMAGRANGLQVIDGPYVKVRDSEGFREFCKRTQILGYDGKWALHPDQVTILNEIFGVSQEQFDRAVDILEAYEKATTEGDRKGAVMFGDEMIDEASRKVAIKVVSRGERAGLSRSATERADGAFSRDSATTLRPAASRCRSGSEPTAGKGRRHLLRSGRCSSRSTTSSSCRSPASPPPTSARRARLTGRRCATRRAHGCRNRGRHPRVPREFSSVSSPTTQRFRLACVPAERHVSFAAAAATGRTAPAAHEGARPQARRSVRYGVGADELAPVMCS